MKLSWKKSLAFALGTPLLVTGLTLGNLVYGQMDQGIKAQKVSTDPYKITPEDALWEGVPKQTLTLLAQPIALPKPKLTLTEKIEIQAVHDQKSLAFRLTWQDSERSDAGILGKFSDAVALEFPVTLVEGQPPSPFMGEVGKPVHIYHWRAQYQKDLELGRHPTMKDLYPNLSIDAYPLDYPNAEAPKGSATQKMTYIPGQAARNPQSFKKHGIDEIFAEGFGSSSVAESIEAQAQGVWKNGAWSVVISRPLKSEQGSELKVGPKNFVCLAVWQGGKNEVGSRKSVTLAWVELSLE